MKLTISYRYDRFGEEYNFDYEHKTYLHFPLSSTPLVKMGAIDVGRLHDGQVKMGRLELDRRMLRERTAMYFWFIV